MQLVEAFQQYPPPSLDSQPGVLSALAAFKAPSSALFSLHLNYQRLRETPLLHSWRSGCVDVTMSFDAGVWSASQLSLGKPLLSSQGLHSQVAANPKTPW